MGLGSSHFGKFALTGCIFLMFLHLDKKKQPTEFKWQFYLGCRTMNLSLLLHFFLPVLAQCSYILFTCERLEFWGKDYNLCLPSSHRSQAKEHQSSTGHTFQVQLFTQSDWMKKDKKVNTARIRAITYMHTLQWPTMFGSFKIKTYKIQEDK